MKNPLATSVSTDRGACARRETMLEEKRARLEIKKEGIKREKR